MEDHDPGKSFASPLADENEIFVPFLHFYLVAVCDVKFYFVNRSRGDGDKALFASLPFYFDEAFVEIKIGQFEVDKFRNTKSATV